MKIESIYRNLNKLYTISKNNNYYVENTMHGSIKVMDDFIFSYKIEIKDWTDENNMACLTIDCAKYNIHVEYRFYQTYQTITSIVDSIFMILFNMRKMLLNIKYST